MKQEEFEQKQAEVSDKELTETIIKTVLKMCASGDKTFTMSVPPRVDDFDMAVFELIRRFEELKEKASETPADGLKKDFSELNEAWGKALGKSDSFSDKRLESIFSEEKINKAKNKEEKDE